MAGGEYFGSADGKSAFYQIAMAHDSKHKTAFHIRGKGCFEFLRMPFGLKNAPATFIRAMDQMIAGSKRLRAFVDDIKWGSPSWKAHLEDIADLCSRSLHNNLRLSPKKMEIGFTQIKSLGCMVDADGLHPDPAKVAAIEQISRPQTVTELRAFLGMTGFYQGWIPHYATLSGPLSSLTAKSKDVVADWTDEHTRCFAALKTALASEPCLAYPYFDKPFILTTDWQPGCIAAILSQKSILPSGEEAERPVHFSAKKLTGYEANWPATVGECAASTWGVRKYHAYLFGRKFELVTDHKALVHMLKSDNTAGKLARWSVELQNYDFNIEHRPGTELANADGLTRVARATDATTVEEDTALAQHASHSNHRG